MENQLNAFKKIALLTRKAQLKEVIEKLSTLKKFDIKQVEDDMQFIKKLLNKLYQINNYDDLITEIDMFGETFNDIYNYYVYKSNVTTADSIYGKTINTDFFVYSAMEATLTFIGSTLRIL